TERQGRSRNAAADSTRHIAGYSIARMRRAGLALHGALPFQFLAIVATEAEQCIDAGSDFVIEAEGEAGGNASAEAGQPAGAFLLLRIPLLQRALDRLRRRAIGELGDGAVRQFDLDHSSSPVSGLKRR